MSFISINAPNKLSSHIIAFLTCSGVLLTPVSQAIGDDADHKIYVKKGRKQNYYHMEYVITADNLLMAESKSPLQLVNDGGHFSVHIKRSAFPVPAPACNKNILLEMPGTKSTQLSALKKIRKKRDLHNTLWEIANNSQKEQKVVIELNPYVKIVDRNPLELELTTCKVYFRTARDAYVNYIGKLK